MTWYNDGQPKKCTFSVGAEAGNAIITAIQLQTEDNQDMSNRANVFAYLSDDANGDSIAGTAPDGAVAISTDGLMIELIAKKAWMLTSEADGDIAITITESGADTWYLVVVIGGELWVSPAITFA